MTTILSFLFVLGVLIFVHELGHYMMAKRLGVRVLTFSLGFGPAIVSFRRRQIEWVLGAVPIGGYVRVHGMNPHEEADLEALVGGTLERYGRIDGVVNSTGHPASGEILELTDEQWHEALNLVVLNVVRISRLVTPAGVCIAACYTAGELFGD